MSPEPAPNPPPEPVDGARAPWVNTSSEELPGIDRGLGERQKVGLEDVHRPRFTDAGGEAELTVVGDDVARDLPAQVSSGPDARGAVIEAEAVFGGEGSSGGVVSSKRPRKAHGDCDNSGKSSAKKKPRSKRERMQGSLAEILDVEGAAEALGISRRLALRLLREGKLPGKKVGREWRVLRSAILTWLKTPDGGEPSWLKGAIESGRATLEKKD